MGSHDPLGYLKHNLWPKERSEVKLAIWLLTIKIHKSPRFPYVKVAYHIPLEKLSTRAITLFQSEFCIQSYGPPKLWESQFKEFQDSHLRVIGQNDIWVLAQWPSTKNTMRGKVVASPKFGPWWVVWVCVCLWFVRAPKVHQKCSNYALTNMLFGLCKFMWIIKPFFTLPNPIPELQHTPLPTKGYKPRNAP
jgi:hypothetical protein